MVQPIHRTLQGRCWTSANAVWKVAVEDDGAAFLMASVKRRRWKGDRPSKKESRKWLLCDKSGHLMTYCNAFKNEKIDEASVRDETGSLRQCTFLSLNLNAFMSLTAENKCVQPRDQ
ncbi:hypothetical protein M514_25173 [Trichuris suis]|uniref:Uncharacterized protein n=1 Tax=Trichuris suis TaxID=68888 RepID=A0A085MZF9_9BILA|nr:hypothetical protein M514_25173 [Trichuris suis]